MKKLVLLSILALPFFALAQSDTSTLTGTISALKGGLTSIPTDAAVANIKSWQTQLQGSDDPLVQGIATNLGKLSDALQADTVDSANVGSLLSSIGTDTVSAAEDVDSAQSKAQLIELGNLLLQGDSLVGGTVSSDMGDMMSGGEMSGGMMLGGN